VNQPGQGGDEKDCHGRGETIRGTATLLGKYTTVTKMIGEQWSKRFEGKRDKVVPQISKKNEEGLIFQKNWGNVDTKRPQNRIMTQGMGNRFCQNRPLIHEGSKGTREGDIESPGTKKKSLEIQWPKMKIHSTRKKRTKAAEGKKS